MPEIDPVQKIETYRFVVVPRQTYEHYQFAYEVVDLVGDRGHLTSAAEGVVWCQTYDRPSAKHIAEALNRFPPEDTDSEEPF